MNHDPFLVPPSKKVDLSDYDPRFSGKFKEKEEVQEKLARDIERLSELQSILYAEDTRALLVIFQALDAAGKDSVIKHVMSGVNPQGVEVRSFKAPSIEELDHDYLWRCVKVLPEQGRIGIFNRSYYEEVLVVRVHPEFLKAEMLPPEATGKDIWNDRFEDINNFERYLTRNGTVILKFFLNVSKEEQRQRFLKRIEHPEKTWKFSIHDVEERRYWKDYRRAYEDMLCHTSTKWAPWYVIPADRKWFTHAAVADIIVSTLESMKLRYPTIDAKQRKAIEAMKADLEADGTRVASKKRVPKDGAAPKKSVQTGTTGPAK